MTTAGTLPLGIALTVFGLGLVGSGIFPMDPMRGYPPGTAQELVGGEQDQQPVVDRRGIAAEAHAREEARAGGQQCVADQHQT